jgi:hypothetical protein
MSEIPTFAMSDDDLDGIEALAEACKPWNPLREASEALVGEVRRLRATVDAALALHQRAVQGHWIYCERCDSEDYAEPWPCATVRALAPVADPDLHTTSDEETT